MKELVDINMVLAHRGEVAENAGWERASLVPTMGGALFGRFLAVDCRRLLDLQLKQPQLKQLPYARG